MNKILSILILVFLIIGCEDKIISNEFISKPDNEQQKCEVSLESIWPSKYEHYKSEHLNFIVRATFNAENINIVHNCSQLFLYNINCQLKQKVYPKRVFRIDDKIIVEFLVKSRQQFKTSISSTFICKQDTIVVASICN